ncbi:MAG: hypothetical protein HYZ31_02860 [Gammaproteobacteria bacterium]|nr:hypothetical protein [Gammaproteobacteria bacterium]
MHRTGLYQPIPGGSFPGVVSDRFWLWRALRTLMIAFIRLELSGCMSTRHDDKACPSPGKTFKIRYKSGSVVVS